MGFLSKAEQFRSIRAAVAAWVDKLPMNEEFSLKELERNVKRLFPQYRNKFGHTFDRRLRECREDRFGYDWYPVCIDKIKSRYKKMSIKDAQKWNKPKRVLM